MFGFGGVSVCSWVEPVPATWFLGVQAGIRRPAHSPNGALRGAVGVFGPRWQLPGVLQSVVLPVYHRAMVTKRSVSLADDVATAVETAAGEDGVSFSAWLSTAAERQLRVRQGLRGVAAWEAEAGALTAEEIAAGEALLARLLSGVSGMASRVRRR